MCDHQTPHGRVLGDGRKDTHDALPFSLSSAAVGSSARITDGSPTTARGNRHPLLLAAAELAWIVPGLAGKPQPDRGRPAPCPWHPRQFRRAHRAQGAHCRRRERRKQVIGLEHEADVLAPQLGQVLWVLARNRIAADANGAFGRRQQAAEDRQKCRLAAPEGPISSVSSPPLSARSTPLRHGFARPDPEVLDTTPFASITSPVIA